MRDNPTSRSKSKRAAGGFSLVELMVALTIGGLALGSIYAVSAASSRHFREQQRISTTQTSLRMAMDLVKKDFQRAGYLGTPNANVPAERCGGAAPSIALGPAPTTLSAVSWFLDAIPGTTDPPAFVDPTPTQVNKANIALDTVVLTGNYSTGGEYPVSSVVSGGVVLPENSQSFRRDFFTVGGSTLPIIDITALQSAFVPGRMVRLHAPNETSFFSRVSLAPTDSGGATPFATVSLTDAPPPSCSLAQGWIAPVNKIQYHVVAATGAEAERFPQGTTPTVAILKRTEVDPTAAPTNNVIAPLIVNGNVVDDRSILDYVVSFNLRFLMNNNGQKNSVQWLPATAAQVIANPERIIAVIIDIAARTPEQEPTLPWVTGFLGTFPESGPRTFKVFVNRPGAARVRTAHAELLLPNIAFKGY